MARTTKQLSGGGKDKFLRGIVAAEEGVPKAAAKRLGDALCGAITDVRVRKETWEGLRDGDAATPKSAAIAVKQAEPKLAEPTQADAAPATAATAFDPFAFSALAVLTKKGKAALAEQLAKIDQAADLHALAQAQHLTVDAAMTDITGLRAAILTATEQRLAERRAAAS